MSGQAPTRFTIPTAEQVEHAFRELGYEERFVGHKMSSSIGNTPTDMYSLREAVVFLVGTKWDTIGPETHKATLNWFDLDRLVAWLRDTVGDAELADAIAQETAGLENHKARSECIAGLLAERMAQYREVLEPASSEADGTAGADDDAAGAAS